MQSERCKNSSFEELKNLISEESVSLVEKYHKYIKRAQVILKKPFYLGISIYKKNEHNYEIIYSLSLYKNRENQLVITENEFTGFSFENLEINKIPHFNEENCDTKKSFKYLKTFFPNMTLNTETDNCFLIMSYKKDSFIFQILFVFDSATPEEIEKVVKYIDTLLGNLKDMLDCLPYMHIKQKIKNSKILKNIPILIIDLKRKEDREKNANTDAVLTKKLIFDILEIAKNHNFKSLNHTGDGFIFMYTESLRNLSIDTNNFINEIKSWFESFKDYMKTLSKEVNDYKIRGILGICEKIYEFPYPASYNNKIFYSWYLDNLFIDLNEIAQIETELFNKADIYIAISKNENFTIEKAKELDINKLCKAPSEKLKKVLNKYKIWKA